LRFDGAVITSRTAEHTDLSLRSSPRHSNNMIQPLANDGVEESSNSNRIFRHKLTATGFGQPVTNKRVGDIDVYPGVMESKSKSKFNPYYYRFPISDIN
jgi:hypothetical protein